MTALFIPPAVGVETEHLARDFVRWAISIAGTSSYTAAADLFAARWPRSKSLDRIQRGAVAAGTTDGTWGSQLAPLKPLGDAFIAATQDRSIFARLAGMRRVPANVAVPRQTAAASVGWVGQGKVTPISAGAFDEVTVPPTKISGIIALSKELLRASNPYAEAILGDDLGAVIASFTDGQFLDPDIAAVADVSPASITHGAPAVTATGTTLAAFRADASYLVEAMIGDGAIFEAPAWAMTQATALRLALLGIDPALKLNGGTLFGIPVLCSVNAPGATTSPASARVFLLDAAAIQYADEGVELDVSQQTSLQMDTAPDDPVSAATKMISLWQAGLVGLKATRFVTWKARRGGAAGYIEDAHYGAA